jgi:transcriptional regulator with XRE-family HTH domain
MNIAIRLRALRKEKNMTQEELAKLINSTKANISKYETGKVEPNIETIRFFAEFFDVSIDYLLGESNVRHQHDVLAFHTTEDLTEEEWEEIKSYVNYIRSKRDD